MEIDNSKPIDKLICSSLPPLESNGYPRSMMIRGSAAELGDLRSLLMSSSIQRDLVQLQVQIGSNAEASNRSDHHGEIESSETESVHQNSSVSVGLSGVDEDRIQQKRSRDDEDSIDEDIDPVEELLLHVPSVQCTCSSWDMSSVLGDLLVTSVRILFVSNPENSERCDDVAIDGRCIGLHAVDKAPISCDDQEPLSHIYCQLSDPAGQDVSNGVCCNGVNGVPKEGDDDISEDNQLIEVYFQPLIRDIDFGQIEQCNTCHMIFDSLTKLASLNPAEDTGDGNFLNMLALMAGMEAQNNLGGKFEGESDNDEMVIRFDGNNLVEDEESGEVVPDEERQAMLNRLDEMLIIPPEYEVPSSEEDCGQFDDADECDDTDELL